MKQKITLDYKKYKKDGFIEIHNVVNVKKIEKIEKNLRKYFSIKSILPEYTQIKFGGEKVTLIKFLDLLQMLGKLTTILHLWFCQKNYRKLQQNYQGGMEQK